MNALIIDDEINVREALIETLKIYCPSIVVKAQAHSIKTALEEISKEKMDLLFLDIELSDGTGFELLEQIKHLDFYVVFITAYNQYALEAFKYSSIDYLLKPIDPEDLIAAVHKVNLADENKNSILKLETLLQNLNKISLKDRKLIVRDKENIHAIMIRDIVYLKADGAYTEIYIGAKKILSSKNLKNYEDILMKLGFVRTHNSYLVNISYMQVYNRYENCLVLQNGSQIPVSARKKENLLNYMRDNEII